LEKEGASEEKKNVGTPGKHEERGIRNISPLIHGCVCVISLAMVTTGGTVDCLVVLNYKNAD
jgi:hypothetical protein